MNGSQAVKVFSAVLLALMPTINTSEASEANRMNRCTPSIEPAIIVTVSDAQTGASLEANIVVQDGQFQETLNLRGVTAAGQIMYGGAFERPGRYTINVSKDGYKTVVLKSIKVTKDHCHVLTRKLKVALKRI